MQRVADWVAQERAAKTAWLLADGAQLTTREIAERVELHVKSAYHMMNKLARVLPITLDECGHWQRIDLPLTKRVRAAYRA